MKESLKTLCYNPSLMPLFIEWNFGFSSSSTIDISCEWIWCDATIEIEIESISLWVDLSPFSLTPAHYRYRRIYSCLGKRRWWALTVYVSHTRHSWIYKLYITVWGHNLGSILTNQSVQIKIHYWIRVKYHCKLATSHL